MKITPNTKELFPSSIQYNSGSQTSAGHGPAKNYFGSSRNGNLK